MHLIVSANFEKGAKPARSFRFVTLKKSNALKIVSCVRTLKRHNRLCGYFCFCCWSSCACFCMIWREMAKLEVKDGSSWRCRFDSSANCGPIRTGCGKLKIAYKTKYYLQWTLFYQGIAFFYLKYYGLQGQVAFGEFNSPSLYVVVFLFKFLLGL